MLVFISATNDSVDCSKVSKTVMIAIIEETPTVIPIRVSAVLNFVCPK